jgi:DNA-binding IclR family transcriptional regulator
MPLLAICDSSPRIARGNINGSDADRGRHHKDGRDEMKDNTARKRSTRAGRLPATVPSQTAAKPADDVANARSSLFVNSVEKAMKVLTAFDGTRRHLTLSQIAALTEMDLSSAQRFTYTLTTLGYLHKDEVTRSYELSARLFDFSYHYLLSSELVHRATPYVQQLSKETEETCNITVMDGTDIVFVLRIVSRHVIDPNILVGTRLPAYCTAPGLAMLAHLPDEEVTKILADTHLTAYTQNTVYEPKAIRKRLQAIRAQGYAHSEEEYYKGDISTAAAIVDRNGRALGAINVAVAKPRWKGKADEERLANQVITAAAAISGRR